MKLIGGHSAGVSGSPGRDTRMPPGLEDGPRDGRAAGRVPGDLGDPGPGDGRQPGIIQRAGLRQAAGPPEPGV